MCETFKIFELLINIFFYNLYLITLNLYFKINYVFYLYLDLILIYVRVASDVLW